MKRVSLIAALVLACALPALAQIQGGTKQGQTSRKGSKPAAQSLAPGASQTQTDLSQQIKESADKLGITLGDRVMVDVTSSKVFVDDYRI